METYKLQPVGILAAQLTRGPRRLVLRQLLGVEFLLSVVEPDRTYPYDFVCHALTGYSPQPGDANYGRLLDGDALVTDLVALAEDLSAQAELPSSAWPEAVYSVADLAERFDVSTKTIFRWRRRGLAGWRVRGADRRVRLVFAERCVCRFVAQHAELVTRGSNFSQLTREEREGIVARAATLVQAGQRTVNAVARTVSTETGRAVETIRLILKNHDLAHPGSGIFNRSPLLGEADGQGLAIWEAYEDGATIESLAERFDRPVAWVYRTLTQMRARELRSRRLEFVDSPEFQAADADEAILRLPAADRMRQKLVDPGRHVPEGLPAYLAQLFRIPLLTTVGEGALFRKMNYLRFKANVLREQVDPETVRAAELDRIEALLDESNRIKNEIVQANLRLVVSIAKRHLGSGRDLFETISDGNVSLMRAVDKFDYTRGFKFSTYASWAIMKNYARSVPEQRHQRERYQTGWDEMLDALATVVPEEAESDYLGAVRGSLERMLATLDARERSILRQRYGLDEHGVPQTLEQIGQRFGVSKERIRQLEARALRKLRSDFAADARRLMGT